jgi:hypothetical protein
MDNELTGALISATASIVVALISRTDGRQSGDARPRTNAAFQPWIAACPAIGIWALTSPAAMHPLLAHYNFALIPLAVMALVWFRPIRPMMAASVALGLFAVNWVGWRIAPPGTENEFLANQKHLLLYLSLAYGTAVVAFWVSRWRSRFVVPPPEPPDPPIAGDENLCTNLERLERQFKRGALSDAEFSAAKGLILKCAQPFPKGRRALPCIRTSSPRRRPMARPRIRARMSP